MNPKESKAMRNMRLLQFSLEGWATKIARKTSIKSVPVLVPIFIRQEECADA